MVPERCQNSPNPLNTKGNRKPIAPERRVVFFQLVEETEPSLIRSPNQNISATPVYSTPYATSNPFNLPDAERNLILYIFPKQRTDVGSIPARIPDGVFYNSCLNQSFSQLNTSTGQKHSGRG